MQSRDRSLDWLGREGMAAGRGHTREGSALRCHHATGVRDRVVA